MDRFETLGRSFEELGTAITTMSNYDMDAGYVRLSAPAAVGQVSKRYNFQAGFAMFLVVLSRLCSCPLNIDIAK